MESYEYIIVGAGSAGCVLANRLTEDADVAVLLLEAGKKDSSIKLAMPLYGRRLWGTNPFSWNYESEPEPGINNRRMGVPRGKVLGGSSSINGMMYNRGHPRDYDQWAQTGLTGWSYSDILPYFRKSETDGRGETTFHGGSGPLEVTPYACDPLLYDAFIRSGEAIGIPETQDFHAEQPEGLGVPDYTVTKDGRRASTARMFLRPALARPNLTVETQALGNKVTIEGGRAVGVEYRRRGEIVTARAEREVILCGGAINSPQLLMLSGIGPADALREHGIGVAVDAPGVGQNLQDHLFVETAYTAVKPVAFDDELRFDRITMSFFQWLFAGTGSIRGMPLTCQGYTRTRPELERPDIQFICSNISPVARIWFPGIRKGAGHELRGLAVLMHPESRGKVWLRSADPADKVHILHNYLQAQYDVDTLRAGLRRCRELFATEPLKSLVGPEIPPSANAQTDDEIEAFIRETAHTTYHQSGTCRMGPDDMSPVDGALRVKGVDALRVADASVMPYVTGSNTNAPTIMIAEKAADMIRGHPAPEPTEVHFD